MEARVLAMSGCLRRAFETLMPVLFDALRAAGYGGGACRRAAPAP